MHPIKRTLTHLYKGFDTICIASSPRSGSTWLAETLVRIGGLDWVDEPLAMTDRLREAGFVARTYMPSAKPGLETIMQDVLKGRIGYLKLYPRARRRLLLKFVRLNRMMRWTMERYDLEAGILLVRHPCAVVSSQLAMGLRKNSIWARVTSPAPDVPAYLVEAVEALAHGKASVERILAINWAVDHVIPLIHERPPNTIVVAYEALLTDPERGLRAICQHCRMAYRHVNTRTPSRTASPDFRPATQIDKWRTSLAVEAQAEVREVVSTIIPTFDEIAADLGMPAW